MAEDEDTEGSATTAYTQWALRHLGGTRAALMRRRAVEGSTDVLWQDVATFDSYNRAQEVLAILQGKHLQSVVSTLDALISVAAAPVNEIETEADRLHYCRVLARNIKKELTR